MLTKDLAFPSLSPTDQALVWIEIERTLGEVTMDAQGQLHSQATGMAYGYLVREQGFGRRDTIHIVDCTPDDGDKLVGSHQL